MASRSQSKIRVRSHLDRGLAYANGASLPSWGRFLAGIEPIKANAFKADCTVLQLNWQEIVDRPPQPVNIEINGLVPELRQKSHTKLQLWDIGEPIDLTNRYVEVNILDKITSW
ncbi:hypothetical protein [Microcoleus sp. bin38.metabat.b11b12b14.051]|uniref:hypothetical protein n=1 Tax=Microcoleus sp. bin38.metabat.b11b12b14.051 TaxID=2742709 RepID=UPI0025E216D4|nr:hypothetical protein [Microcoleus sp. bin38.metabat.b11b12b14.051]